MFRDRLSFGCELGEHFPSPLCRSKHFIQFNSVFMCIIRATGALYPYFNHSIFYTVFIVQFGFPATEPGVPYNITVRASTGVGKGEPVSIVVFTVQQGNADVMIMYKNCAVPNMSIQEWLIKRSISCVHSQRSMLSVTHVLLNWYILFVRNDLFCLWHRMCNAVILTHILIEL